MNALGTHLKTDGGSYKKNMNTVHFESGMPLLLKNHLDGPIEISDRT